MPDTADVRPVRLFVSHHSSKLDVALHVEKALAVHGISCWIAPRDVDPGEPFDREIQTAIQASSAILLLFCSRSDRSRHVKRELILADSAHKAIMPLRLEAVDPKELAYHLADSQWIDWLEQRDETIQRIALKAKQFHASGSNGSKGLSPVARALDAQAATFPPAAPSPPPPARTVPLASAPEAPKVTATSRVNAAREVPPLVAVSPAQRRPVPTLGGLPVWLWIIAGGAVLFLLLALILDPANSQGGDSGTMVTPADATSALESPAGAPADTPVAAVTTSNPSFDCSKATLAVEKVICASDELAALDRQLAAGFQQASINAGAGADGVRSDQIAWIEQVGRECSDEPCVALARLGA